MHRESNKRVEPRMDCRKVTTRLLVGGNKRKEEISMKKISSVLLALFLSLSLASCVAPNEDSHTDAKENDVSTSAATEIGTVAVETEPENEHPTTPVPELTPEALR